LTYIRTLLAIPLLLVFTGCLSQPSTPGNSSSITTANAPSQADETATLENPAGNPVSPINTVDSSETTPPPAGSNPFVRLAQEDLAKHLKIDPSQIHFLKISDIDWQDITQGCTAPPGQTYTKGRLSGYRIWLEEGGKNYLYHIGLDDTVLFCTN
jgi:hypothetical protein